MVSLRSWNIFSDIFLLLRFGIKKVNFMSAHINHLLFMVIIHFIVKLELKIYCRAAFCCDAVDDRGPGSCLPSYVMLTTVPPPPLILFLS